MEERLTKKELREKRRLEFTKQEEAQERTEKVKKIAIWAGVALLLIGSVWGLFKLANKPSLTSSQTEIVKAPPLTQEDITKGNKDAKIVLIEYSDFQCPACGYYYPIAKQLTEEYKDKILFAYRFFPLRQIHQNAMSSSQAAYAAHLQGKFWEMHDMLFESQKDWSESSDAKDIFISYAKKLNLNEEQFKKDMESDEALKVINNQYSAGAQAGINSTPTFFLNGVKIQNPQAYEAFKSLIESKLKTQ